MRVSILSLLWMLSCTFSAISQSKVIKGRVSDASSGEILTGANVYLLSNWKVGTFTDLEGLFTLNVEGIKDTIVVSFLGYEDLLLPLDMESQNYEILLSQIVRKMEGVVITAQKLAAEEFTSKKINRLDIYTNPSAKADPLLAVNSLPSATTTDESANISFRGSGPNATGILFNNVPLYDAVRFSQLNGIGTFSIFNTSIVDNMQVFPGNPPIEFGNTASGLISIETSNALPSQAINNFTVSMAGIGALTSRRTSEKTALIAFFNYQPSFLLKSANPKSLQEIEGFLSFDGGLHYLHSLNEKTTLKLFNYTLSEGYDFNFKSPTFRGLFEQRKLRNFTVATLRHKLPFGTLNLNAGMSFTDAQFKYSKSEIEVFSRDLFLSGDYTYTGKSFSIKVGLSHDDRNESSEGQIPSFFYAIGIDHPTTSFSFESRIPISEAFVYGKWYISEDLILGSGIRKNLSNDHVEDYWSGQVNVRYLFSDRWSLNGAMGQYHRATFGQVEALDFIRSRQASLDLRYDSRSLELTISGFRNRLESELRNDIYGVEVFAKVDFNNWLSGQLSYTYLDSKLKTEEIAYSGPFDLNYFVKGNLQYKLPQLWLITTNFSMRQGIPYLPVVDASYDEALDAFRPTYAPLEKLLRRGRYQIFDLSVSKQLAITEDISTIIFASISNVFDFKNERGRSFIRDYSAFELTYFSRRTIFAGAVFNF